MSEELKDRDGMGRCKECRYHNMRDYDHYCTKPDRMIDGQKERWMNETFSRGWHNCCITFGD